MSSVLKKADKLNLSLSICKNGTLNTKNSEITSDELIMCIFNVVTSNKE